MSYYDETAEKAILGAALSDPRITATVKLDPLDFAYATHGALWQAIAKTHASGLVPDLSTIVPHLHGVNPSSIPPLMVEVVGLGIPSNADAYAGTILDRSERRRIAGALEGVRQKLDSPEVAAADVLSYAESALLTHTSMDEAAETLYTLDEFLDRDLPPTTWAIPDLLATGDRLVLTGVEGFGKALALDTPIPTPTGWTTMGDLTAGDWVLGDDGRPARVRHAMPVQHGRPCYRVEFSDGSSIVADERHEWLTETLRAREVAAKQAKRGDTKPRGTDQRHKTVHHPAVVETGHIRDTLHARDGHALNHSVTTAQPLALPEAPLPIDPYTLGAWLGDGTSRGNGFTCADDGIVERIREHEQVRKLDRPYAWALGDGRGWPREASFKARLRALGVLQDKRIPTTYLRASYGQRLALLQGLMDTDGSITGKASACEFTGTNAALMRDVHELLMTFGIKATMSESAATLDGREVGRRWRILFQTDLPVFHLARKAERIRPVSRRAKLRYITGVTPVQSVPVRCIEVENASHLYLAGESFIPTHNSVLMRQIGVAVAAGLNPFTLRAIPPKRVLVVDCENPERIMMAKLGDLRSVIRRRGHRADSLFLKRYPQGLNLAEPRELLDLHHLLTITRPDLLLIGPAYKLYVGGSNSREEDLARLVTSKLDALREEFGFALVLEHHSPHGTSEGRSVRPIGSSLWLRWPEFGLGLRPHEGTRIVERDADLVPWRGSRDERPWPTRLQAGQPDELPWVAPAHTYREARP